MIPNKLVLRLSTVWIGHIELEEKKARESMLGTEFQDALQFINSLLPSDDRIQYISLDFHKAHKE